MDEKVSNYISFGVANIWLIDSQARTGWDCSNGDWVRRERFEVPGTPMYLSLPDIFAKIDEDNG
jgi:Uma2 family endonuclease